jgi:hypothetical protein
MLYDWGAMMEVSRRRDGMPFSHSFSRQVDSSMGAQNECAPLFLPAFPLRNTLLFDMTGMTVGLPVI